MKKLSSWVFALLEWIMYTAGLNVLFLLCSLPAVTIGASLTALFAGQRALVKKEPCFRAFFQTLRASFWRSTAAWLIFLPVNALLLFHGFSLIPSWDKAPFQLIFVLFCALLALSITFTAFVFYSRFEVKLLQLLRYGIELGMSNFLRTATIALLFTLPFVLAYFAGTITVFLFLGVLLMFFYFSLAAWAAVWLMNKPFIRFAQQVLGMDISKYIKEEPKHDH